MGAGPACKDPAIPTVYFIVFCLVAGAPAGFLKHLNKLCSMKKIFFYSIALCLIPAWSFSQSADTTHKVPDRTSLRFNISPDGSRYFQATFLNQVWMRFNESNDGTTLFSKSAPSTFDIGLRRTRIQLFG